VFKREYRWGYPSERRGLRKKGDFGGKGGRLGELINRLRRLGVDVNGHINSARDGRISKGMQGDIGEGGLKGGKRDLYR